MSSNRAQISDKIATALLWMCGFLIILILLWFLTHILLRGLPVIDWNFLTTKPKAMEAGGGIAPQLFNTFYIMVLSLIFSLPIGVGAGIYLAEYARKSRLTDLVRLGTESLASVPSIVLGLFGAIIFVNSMGWGFTILGGSLTLALLNLPVLVRVTEESLKAVPKSFREGSLALGATDFQTLWRVVIPAALPGIFTGITLVGGRAFGETAVLIFTAGMSTSRHLFDFSLFASGETLAVHLWATRTTSLVPDATRIADGAAALLIIVVLFFNLCVGLPGRILQHKRLGKKKSRPGGI